MYFRLNPECYFIKGKKCGAIFDLIDGKIYALDKQETKLVTSCENNIPIQRYEKFLVELKKLCLGNFYPNSVYIQKLRVGSPIREVESESLTLNRAFLEINNSCNRNCWFCGYYGIKRSFGCMGCNKWKENGKLLNLERWKSVIDELNDLECRDIFITGGDLTLAWNRTMDILDYANGKFTNIYITFHQQSLSLEIMNSLAKKANVIVQTDELSNIKSKNVTTLLIVRPENLADINNMCAENIITDFIIDSEDSLSNDMPIMSKKKISPIGMYKFLNNLEYHPCLGHTLTVCYNGNIIPCPMMRKHSFGNVRSKDLCTIIKEKWDYINKFWTLNLDGIKKCKNCEFRYVCNDCRALEENLTGDLVGKMMCNYNPNEGVWL